MKKLRIYLDTSVISHLKQEDVPEKMADTLKLWEMFKRGEYQAVLSTVTLEEMNRCSKEKVTVLTEFLNQIDYEVVKTNATTFKLAEKFIDFGILKKKSFDDCTHIAAAIISNCDIIVSWNFKHIVNHKTIQGVKVVTTLEGYKDVIIYSPTFLVEGGNDDE